MKMNIVQAISHIKWRDDISVRRIRVTANITKKFLLLIIYHIHDLKKIDAIVGDLV